MSRIIGIRKAARLLAAGIGPAICTSMVYSLRSPVIRLDSDHTTTPTHRSPPTIETKLSPRMVQQLSSGSLAGFCAGLVVAVFSRTLVILGTLFAFTILVASRYGLDLPQVLGVKRFVKGSPWWATIEQKPWFTASFTTTFALAAFVRL
jgi:hypothetical protein